MSLRLLVDEDTQRRQIVSSLRATGHDTVTVNEADLQGQEDPTVLAHALQERRVLLTMNCRDFLRLHEAGHAHIGILCIYKDRDPSRNMTLAEIIRAIANLEASDWEFTGQFVALNQWNY